MDHRADVSITPPAADNARPTVSRLRRPNRLAATAAALLTAAAIAVPAAAQESAYGPIQDDVADILTSRGLDYEFDGPDLPEPPTPVAVETVPVESAPLPPPPVESTSPEPAEGSEGIPVEDPF